MYSRFKDFSSNLAAAETAEDAWDLLVEFTRSMGMLYVHTWFGSSVHEITLNSTCPDWWMPHYMDNEFWRHDTLAAHCMTGRGPRPYGVDKKGRAPGESRGTEEILNFMRSTIGLGAGVGFPVFLDNGTRIGGINLGFSDVIEDLEGVPAGAMLEAMMAATAAHTKIHALRQGEFPARELSPRERECLLFLAAGLRTKEISDRLNLSDATVAFHIQNAKRKLGADTREQAVARAVVLGAITP